MARLPEWACFPSAVFEQLCEASETEAGRSRTIALYCDPGCGFCLTWTRLARQAGYTTNVSDTADMASAKRRLGVRGNLASCHTGIVDGSRPRSARALCSRFSSPPLLTL